MWLTAHSSECWLPLREKRLRQRRLITYFANWFFLAATPVGMVESGLNASLMLGVFFYPVGYNWADYSPPGVISAWCWQFVLPDGTLLKYTNNIFVVFASDLSSGLISGWLSAKQLPVNDPEISWASISCSWQTLQRSEFVHIVFTRQTRSRL